MQHTFARTTVFVAAVALGLGVTTTAHAGPSAQPYELVGKADFCAPGWPAGARIVAAEWIEGIGLPDNGGSNEPTDPDGKDTPSPKDKRNGLLLAKTGSAATCSLAGARIKGFDPILVTADTTVGFDLRQGSHCGFVFPGFLLRTQEGGVYFLACELGSTSPAPQDPARWTRYRFTLPEVSIGETVTAIEIVFDLGPDSGNGLAVLDNIQIGDRLITSRNKSVPANP